MTFEEKFPSLKKSGKMMHPNGDFYRYSVVEKHCFDKSIIKKKIQEIDEELKTWHDRSGADYVLNQFKELVERLEK